MRFMVLFIASLVLLGIVFAGTVSCKSDKANSLAPGQTGTNPGQAKKTVDNLVESSSQSISYQGQASLENWLNQPTNYFPWYSSGGSSFYSQGYSESTFSPFREFYTTSGTTVVSGIISTPVRFDIAQKTPSRIYFGTGQVLPYSQYTSIVPSKTNDLWVQGATDWSQYVVSPLGTWLQLVANAPVGGPAGFYEIVQTDTSTVKYSTYQFNQGYNTMNYNADQVGRHMLYFVVNNQPSNVVVVDVFAQAQPGTGTIGIVPIAGQNQPIVLGGNGQTTTIPNGLTTTTSNGQTTTTTTNGVTTTTSNGQPTTTSDGTGTTVTSSYS
jgi:hypothetical protein